MNYKKKYQKIILKKIFVVIYKEVFSFSLAGKFVFIFNLKIKKQKKSLKKQNLKKTC